MTYRIAGQVAGLGEEGSSGGDEAEEQRQQQQREEAFRRLEGLGYRVGQGLVER